MSTWDDVVELALTLPGVEASTTYGSAPAMKVRGKIVCWYRDNPDAFVVRVADLAEKDALIAESPDTFFTTSHYDGAAYVLGHLERIPKSQLGELIEDSWRLLAAKRVVEAYDADHGEDADA
ncbi:MAG: MmcQ/YjbR family DNA-binding protein [Solirubrobacteraceae bacterium]|nr:MmcQ/YjbR family DNA-binding protein [Solirubrobacteraceae bacterium]